MAAPDSQTHFSPPRSHFGAWVGVVLLFAAFALLAWAVIGSMPRRDHYEDKRAQVRYEKLKAYHEEVDPHLAKYAWVEKEKGTARIPIQHAMELAVVDLAQKNPAPAGPLPVAGAQPGQQVTAPVAPTPAASPDGAPRPTPAPALVGKDSEAKGQGAAVVKPPDAAPGTQPGPNATPAAAPVSGANQPNVGLGRPTATPVQSPAGTPLPVPGTTPR